MNDRLQIARDFKDYFGRELPLANNYFDSEEAFYKAMKKVLYFTQAVIKPLERKGMHTTDSIVDVASGNGQLSLALALLGYTNLTLFDLDKIRLEDGRRLIEHFCPNANVQVIHKSATALDREFDVLISYQTIEHLSDEGNYSVAKKSCQIAFLQLINEKVRKLCYINAPNRTFPIDGHDTGKPLVHLLPVKVKQYLIRKGIVKCSWAGVCRPVSIHFLNTHLSNFSLQSSYYAFDSMKAYLQHRPSFDYMGCKMPQLNTENLPRKKALLNTLSLLVGKRMQMLLPVLSVIYLKSNASGAQPVTGQTMAQLQEAAA